MAHSSGVQAYMESLPQRERHLASRLESFGDIVFGFSMSQLALQLDLPKTAADLIDNPLKYVLYFGTFGILSGLWLSYHRMMSTGFRPARTDLALAFLFLAFIGLIPYSMYANVRFAAAGPGGASYGFAAYFLCFLVTTLVSATLGTRNLRRTWTFVDEEERSTRMRSIVITAGIATLCAALVVVDIAAGVQVAGPLTFLFLFPAFAKRMLRNAPGWLARWIRPPEGSAGVSAEFT
jgi:uncharacterized membrane protein